MDKHVKKARGNPGLRNSTKTTNTTNATNSTNHTTTARSIPPAQQTLQQYATGLFGEEHNMEVPDASPLAVDIEILRSRLLARDTQVLEMEKVHKGELQDLRVELRMLQKNFEESEDEVLEAEEKIQKLEAAKQVADEVMKESIGKHETSYWQLKDFSDFQIKEKDALLAIEVKKWARLNEVNNIMRVGLEQKREEAEQQKQRAERVMENNKLYQEELAATNNNYSILEKECKNLKEDIEAANALNARLHVAFRKGQQDVKEQRKGFREAAETDEVLAAAENKYSILEMEYNTLKKNVEEKNALSAGLHTTFQQGQSLGEATEIHQAFAAAEHKYSILEKECMSLKDNMEEMNAVNVRLHSALQQKYQQMHKSIQGLEEATEKDKALAVAENSYSILEKEYKSLKENMEEMTALNARLHSAFQQKYQQMHNPNQGLGKATEKDKALVAAENKHSIQEDEDMEGMDVLDDSLQPAFQQEYQQIYNPEQGLGNVADGDTALVAAENKHSILDEEDMESILDDSLQPAFQQGYRQIHNPEQGLGNVADGDTALVAAENKHSILDEEDILDDSLQPALQQGYRQIHNPEQGLGNVADGDTAHAAAGEESQSLQRELSTINAELGADLKDEQEQIRLLEQSLGTVADRDTAHAATGEESQSLQRELSTINTELGADLKDEQELIKLIEQSLGTVADRDTAYAATGEESQSLQRELSTINTELGADLKDEQELIKLLEQSFGTVADRDTAYAAAGEESQSLQRELSTINAELGADLKDEQEQIRLLEQSLGTVADRDTALAAQEECRILKENVEEMSKRNRELEAALQKKQQRTRKQKQPIDMADSAPTEIESLKADIEAKKANIETLNKTIEAQKVDYHEVRVKLDEGGEKSRKRAEEIRAKGAEIRKHLATINRLEAQVASAELENKGLKDELKNKISASTIAEKLHLDDTRELQSLRSSVNNQRPRMVKMMRERDTFWAYNKELSKEVSRLQALAEQRDSFAKSLQEKQPDIQGLLKDIMDLEEENRELKSSAARTGSRRALVKNQSSRNLQEELEEDSKKESQILDDNDNVSSEGFNQAIVTQKEAAIQKQSEQSTSEEEKRSWQDFPPYVPEANVLYHQHNPLACWIQVYTDLWMYFVYGLFIMSFSDEIDTVEDVYPAPEPLIVEGIVIPLVEDVTPEQSRPDLQPLLPMLVALLMHMAFYAFLYACYSFYLEMANERSLWVTANEFTQRYFVHFYRKNGHTHYHGLIHYIWGEVKWIEQLRFTLQNYFQISRALPG